MARRFGSAGYHPPLPCLLERCVHVLRSSGTGELPGGPGPLVGLFYIQAPLAPRQVWASFSRRHRLPFSFAPFNHFWPRKHRGREVSLSKAYEECMPRTLPEDGIPTSAPVAYTNCDFCGMRSKLAASHVYCHLVFDHGSREYRCPDVDVQR